VHVVDAVGAGHRDLADEAAPHEWLELLVDGRAPPVQAHLDDPPGALLRLDHLPALDERDRERFLDVDVLARLEGQDRLHRVPVVGGRDADGVDVLAVEQPPEVPLPRNRGRDGHPHPGDAAHRPVARVNGRGVAPQVGLVDVAEGGDLDVGLAGEGVEELVAPVADADEADADAVAGNGRGGGSCLRRRPAGEARRRGENARLEETPPACHGALLERKKKQRTKGDRPFTRIADRPREWSV
jgi:hypothetical protein